MAAERNIERSITFEEGLLGVTLKRSIVGRAVVSEINQDTQAASNGIYLGDVVRQVGELDLRGPPLEKKAWLEFIDLLKTSSRPLVLVVSTGTEEEIKQKPKKNKKSDNVLIPSSSEETVPTNPSKESEDNKGGEKEENEKQNVSNSSTIAQNPILDSSTIVSESNEKKEVLESSSSSPSLPSTSSSSPTTEETTISSLLPTMNDLSKCLEWPQKGPLSKGASNLIGNDKRSKEFVVKSGLLNIWTSRGWFGGSNLQPRQVFLCNTILLICEPIKEDEKRLHIRSKKNQMNSSTSPWQDRKWLVETAIELEACLVRDVPPKPLQGLNDEELRGAFELTAPIGTVVLVGESNKERAVWVDHIFQCLLKVNPDAVQTKPGWIHQIRSGNLLSAASACDLQQMFIALEREPPTHLVSGEFKLMATAQDIDEPDANGDNALHLVLKHLEVLSQYYSPTTSSSNNHVEMVLNVEAIQKTVAEAVVLLISAGASISVCNRAGKMPLNIAAHFLSDSVISALLSGKDGGIQVNFQDELGYTPAHLACFAAASSARLIRHLALLEAKYPDKKLSSKTQHNRSSSTKATTSGVLTSLHRTLGCLCAWGIDLELVDLEGLTITQRLAIGLHFDVLHVVLQCGANASTITQEYGLPLYHHHSKDNEPSSSMTPTIPVSPPPPPTSSQQSPRSPASPTTSKRLSLPDSEIAKFPISNLIHLICGQHLIPRHLSGGLKKFSQDYSSLTTSSSSTAAEEASASSSQTSDNHHEENLIPMPLFALPETLRVLLSHLANKHEANVILKLINAPSPHCGLTPLQLLLRSRGISSPSVASAALLLLIGGCDMFSLDPQGHSIASTIADGLQTHLQRNPLTWYHEDSENIDILSSNKTTNKNMKKEEQEEDDEDGPSHVVIGTMLLVTKGRLAFIGGGDRERSVHFVLIPDKRGIVHNGLNYKGPFLIGLRVKKDELRVSTIAHSSSVKKIDTKNGPIGKRGERIYDAYPIQIENATIEGEDEKPLCILTNQLSERLIWGKYLNKAFHMNNSNNKKSSSSKQSENEKELFGNHANKKGAGAGGGGKRGVDNSANETVDLMNANRNALLERGEKLNELADKTQELSDTASEFEKMCKELEKQQRNRWF